MFAMYSFMFLASAELSMRRARGIEISILCCSSLNLHAMFSNFLYGHRCENASSRDESFALLIAGLASDRGDFCFASMDKCEGIKGLANHCRSVRKSTVSRRVVDAWRRQTDWQPYDDIHFSFFTFSESQFDFHDYTVCVLCEIAAQVPSALSEAGRGLLE